MNQPQEAIDYVKEAIKMEKNYKDCVTVRKTGVREDTRILVERIEEHKKVQEEAIREAEIQCGILQEQHSQMEEMERQLPIFRKKVAEVENKLMSKDKILAILIPHKTFQIDLDSPGNYVVTVSGYKPTVFRVSRATNCVQYVPTMGFPKDFPNYLTEANTITYNQLSEYCNEIESLLSD